MVAGSKECRSSKRPADGGDSKEVGEVASGRRGGGSGLDDCRALTGRHETIRPVHHTHPYTTKPAPNTQFRHPLPGPQQGPGGCHRDGQWGARADGLTGSELNVIGGCGLRLRLVLARACLTTALDETRPPAQAVPQLTSTQMWRWTNMTGEGMRGASRLGSRRVTGSRRRTLGTERRTGALPLATRRLRDGLLSGPYCPSLSRSGQPGPGPREIIWGLG
jgi:hypothetical protein